MASNIDPTKPAAPPAVALAADLRINLGHAKTEIEALQTSDTAQDTSITDHETRITTLEAGGGGGGGGTGGGVTRIFTARIASNFSFSSSTSTPLQWDTKDLDTYGLLASTPGATLTIPSTLNGKILRIGFNCEQNADSMAGKLARANFTSWPAAGNVRPSWEQSAGTTSSALDGGNWSETVQVVTGDTIVLSVYNTGTNPRAVSANNQTWISIDLVGDIQSAVLQPGGDARGCVVRRVANQSIATSTATAISWDTEDIDTDGFFASGSPTIFTIPAGLGLTKIRLSACYTWAANATGERNIFIRRVGDSKVFAQDNRLSAGATNKTIGLAVSRDLIVGTDVQEGDTFNALGFQSSGGNLNFGDAERAWFSLEVIEPKELVGNLHKETLIINSDFSVDQRGSYGTAIADGVFGPDHWIVGSDGASIVTPSQETTNPPSRSISALKLLWGTANKQAFIAQPIASDKLGGVIGGTCSIRFALRIGASATLTKVRAAVLAWTGTKDSMTADVVGTWAGGGTEPTWATNYTREGLIRECTLSTSWTNYQINGISVDTASTNNIMLVLWVDDTSIAVNDDLYVGEVQMHEGNLIGDYQPKQYDDHLWDCLLHAERIDAADGSDTYTYFGWGEIYSATSFRLLIEFKRLKHHAITMSTAAASQFLVGKQATTYTPTALSLGRYSTGRALVAFTISGASTGMGRAYANNNTTAYLLFLAEIAA